MAIGDVHGSIDGLMSILSEADLIDETGSWSGGSATLIQLGDLLDRGVRLREVLDLLMRLELEAPRSGGRVIVLLGNHEVMNLLGITRDVNSDAFTAFVTEESQRRRAEALAAFERLWRRREVELGRQPVFSDEAANQWLAMHPPGFVEYSEAFGAQGVYGAWLRRRPVAVILGGPCSSTVGTVPRSRASESTRSTAARRPSWCSSTRPVTFMIAEGLALPWSSVIELVSEAQRELEWIAAQPANAVPRERKNRASRLDLDFGRRLPDGRRRTDLVPRSRDLGRARARRGDRGPARPARRRPPGRRPLPAAGWSDTLALLGRVLVIDSGMLTSVYGGRPSALEIVGDTLTAIYPGERQTIACAPQPPPPAATATAASRRRELIRAERHSWLRTAAAAGPLWSSVTAVREQVR